MHRKVGLWVIGACSMFLFSPQSWAQTNAQRQAALDSNQHEPQVYQQMLDELRRDYPDYSENQVVAFVFWAHGDLQKSFSDVTIHDVLKGIIDFSRLLHREDMKTSLQDPRNLEQVISLYVVMKQQEGRKTSVGT